MPLYAGVCETNITPPPGVWMCGYAFRPTGCVGVHDELYARALVVDDGATRVGIVGMDLIGLDFDIVERVRDLVQNEAGIHPHALMLNATHTHGGPNVRSFNSMGTRDPAYIEVLTRKLVGVVKQAADQLQPASLAYGRSPVQIGINRRQTRRPDGQTVIGHNFGGPVAPFVDALSVLDSRGRPFALLFSHACHGTTLGGDNLRITADFCGYACEYVRGEVAGDVLPIFLQGCAGNINPYPRSAYADAERHGASLGGAAVEAMETAVPLESADVAYREIVVDLPLIPPPPLATCEHGVCEWERSVEEERRGGHMGRILHAEGMLAFAEHEREIAESGGFPVTPFAIQMLQVGGVRLLGMPGEVFVQYQLDFQRQSAGPLFALGYTNGVHGYVPTQADYALGGYEVDGAHRYYGTLMFADDCERLIRKAAYDLLEIEHPDNRTYGT